MSATKKQIQNVKKEFIFKQGTERTLEYARGNLFQRKDGFRCDIVILPFLVPNDNDSYKTLLFGGMQHVPFNGRIMSYQSLEDWDGFPREALRRVNCNIYDNDRFVSNVSPYFKAYLYKHIVRPTMATPLALLKRKGALKVGNYVHIRDNEAQRWVTSKIKKIENGNSINVERYQWEVPFEEDVKIDSQRIHLIGM